MTMNGIGSSAATRERFAQSSPAPATYAARTPQLPRLVGSRPRRPLTAGSRISARYTGRESEVRPIQ